MAFPQGVKGLCGYINAAIGRFIEQTGGWDQKFGQTLGDGVTQGPKTVRAAEGPVKQRKPPRPDDRECALNHD